MSQKSLAAQAGCSVPWNVERGNNKPPPELLGRLAKCLQVTPTVEIIRHLGEAEVRLAKGKTG